MKSLVFIFIISSLTGCTSVFFQPQKNPYPVTFEKNINPVPFQIESFDHTPLSAWYFNSPKQPAKGLIVQFHGNGSNMTAAYQSVHWLTMEGYDLVTFDFRGYGSTPGEPSMSEVYKDVFAAINYTNQLAKAKNIPLILLGQSLGGSLLLAALEESHPSELKAIVIEGSFYSYQQIAKEKLSISWVTRPFKFLASFLVSEMYSPGGKDKLERLPRVPKILMYSEDDPVVPLHHGVQIFAELKEPKYFWSHPEHGHINAFFVQGGKRRAELLTVLATYSVQPK